MVESILEKTSVINANNNTNITDKINRRSKLDLPIPKIEFRKINENILQKAVQQGVDFNLAKILATRSIPDFIEPIDFLLPKLAKLSSPFKLADIDLAASRVAKAVIDGEVIGLETDHDCDGQTSHAILYYNLVKHFKHPKEKIKSYIGHRLKEGYGLSDSVAKRILADSPRPSLVITADNGSSDEDRIKNLKAENIDVIITDHHQIPKDGIPKSSYACLNPTRADCDYPDNYIAGCMVAWLLMVVVRQKLIEAEYIAKDAPKLSDTLDFVALGTIADCVSMSQSLNNRIVVNYGLSLIQKITRPCWQALKPHLNNPVNSEDLGFRVGPLLNSDGRLACAFGSVSFLLAETLEEAENWVEHLQEQNQNRKAIQKEITENGLAIALEKINIAKDKNQKIHSLSIFLADGHVGVQGISASRIKDAFGLPTVYLAPKFTDPNLVTGSARGIDGSFNVKTAFQYVADKEPNIFVSFGGHKGAGGLTIKKQDVDKFSDLFEEACLQQLQEQKLGPVVYSDGELTRKDLTLSFLNTINRLEPFGREFDKPIFHAKAILANFYPIGDGSHTKLSFNISGRYMKAVWFNMALINKAGSEVELDTNFAIDDEVLVAFSLVENNYKGKTSCELQVVAMQKT